MADAPHEGNWNELYTRLNNVPDDLKLRTLGYLLGSIEQYCRFHEVLTRTEIETIIEHGISYGEFLTALNVEPTTAWPESVTEQNLYLFDDIPNDLGEMNW